MAARLHVDAELLPGAALELDEGVAHRLKDVLRLGAGARVSVFNGRDGEAAAVIESYGRRTVRLGVAERLRLPMPEAGPWLLFAPVKRVRLDWLVEKATELGVSRLCPVMTGRTAVERVNLERLSAHAVAAAEQCGRLTVPLVEAPRPLDRELADWDPTRRLFLCAERGAALPVGAVLDGASSGEPRPWGLLIGPEGGFTDGELDALGNLPFLTPVALGPRTLRADTAVVAALAVLQACIGDWRVGRDAGRLQTV